MVLNHAQLSKHDVELCNELADKRSSIREYIDWQITTIYYSALHLIREDLANKGITVHGHDIQREAMDVNYTNVVTRAYSKLKNASQLVRYEPSAEYTADDLIKFKDFYNQIEAALR